MLSGDDSDEEDEDDYDDVTAAEEKEVVKTLSSKPKPTPRQPIKRQRQPQSERQPTNLKPREEAFGFQPRKRTRGEESKLIGLNCLIRR